MNGKTQGILIVQNVGWSETNQQWQATTNKNQGYIKPAACVALPARPFFFVITY